MMRNLVTVLFAGVSLAATAAHAQNPSTPGASSNAQASLTVQRSLSVATLSPMRFERDAEAAALSAQNEAMDADRPAVIRLTGDPRRAYRIRLPRREGQDEFIEGLRIVSANNGDISVVMGGRLDAHGLDVLEITGRLRDASGRVAALPLSIDYD